MSNKDITFNKNDLTTWYFIRLVFWPLLSGCVMPVLFCGLAFFKQHKIFSNGIPICTKIFRNLQLSKQIITSSFKRMLGPCGRDQNFQEKLNGNCPTVNFDELKFLISSFTGLGLPRRSSLLVGETPTLMRMKEPFLTLALLVNKDSTG